MVSAVHHTEFAPVDLVSGRTYSPGDPISSPPGGRTSMVSNHFGAASLSKYPWSVQQGDRHSILWAQIDLKKPSLTYPWRKT